MNIDPYDAVYWRERMLRVSRAVMKEMRTPRGRKPRPMSEIVSYVSETSDDVRRAFPLLRRKGLVQYIKAKKCKTCGREVVKTAGWVYSGLRRKHGARRRE